MAAIVASAMDAVKAAAIACALIGVGVGGVAGVRAEVAASGKAEIQICGG